VSVCIVHRDGWAVADSRDTMGSLIMPSTAIKVSKAEGFLIAHVGQGILAQKVDRCVKEHGHEVTVLEKVGELLEDKELDGECLAVSYKRKLTHIDGNGLLTELDAVDFWAVGSGEQFVLGRLLAIAETRPVTIEDAEAAVKAVAVYDSGVDDRVQKFFLEQ
jgi:ATP-dependent protease HslVU (ClpYQ) peptidase subunit